jgi:hypothetical protein
LDDCDRVELIYVNPLEKPLALLVQLFDRNGQEVERRKDVISSRGLKTFEFDNQLRSIVFVENSSRMGQLRPVIFKHYESFFDVLHS